MAYSKWFSVLLIVLLFTQALPAKNIEQRMPWQELPKSLVGQRIEVIQTDNKKVSGKLIRIEADGLVIERKKGPLTIPRASASQVSTSVRTRVRYQILGTVIGAAPGIVLTGVAGVYQRNEGGTNADAIVGAAVGIAIAGALLGYFAGRSADTDKTTIHIVP